MATTGGEFVASDPGIQTVAFDAPWSWITKGWADMRRTPGISLAYGALFTLISLLILVGLYLAGGLSLLLPLAGGFLLLGPMFAVGLYETSRKLEEGRPVSLSEVMMLGVRSPGQLAFMGVFLLILYFVWLEIAFLLFMLFLGPQSLQLENIVPTLLFTGPGLGLLATGTVVGAALALLGFAITAVSIPLLMRREIDVATAAITSVRAVANNPAPMLLWAVLIAGMMAFAFATLFVGMILVFPLIGHSTWHAYRSVIPPVTRRKSFGKAKEKASR